MTTLTLSQVLQAYGRKVAGRDSAKRRDSIERDLLLRVGDQQVQRENPKLVKEAGQRPKP